MNHQILNRVLLVIFATAITGCMSPAVRRNGFVKWNYESVIPQIQKAHKKMPVSITIDDLTHAPSEWDMNLPGGILRVVPIACLMSPPISYENCTHDPMGTQINLKHNEVEHILCDELTQAGLFKDVSVDNLHSDFKVTGKIDFEYDMNVHMSGLGVLYPLLVVPVVALPHSKLDYVCKAHLQVISTKTGAVVFSNKYEKESHQQWWPLCTQARLWKPFGEEVFPQIVSAFLTDIQNTPKSSWYQ
jgi:hypothetical protein